MHLDDLLERADRFRNEVIIVGHFSTRYHPATGASLSGKNACPII
jgi:hypothetical protein